MNLPTYKKGMFLENKLGDIFIVESVIVSGTLYLRCINSNYVTHYEISTSNSLRPMIVQPGCFIQFTEPYKIPYVANKKVYMVTHIGITRGKVVVELVTNDDFSKEVDYSELKKTPFEFSYIYTS